MIFSYRYLCPRLLDMLFCVVVDTVLQQNADGASTPAGAAKKTPRIQVIKASQLKDLINSGKKVQVIRIPKRKLDDGQSPGTSGE